MIPFCDLSTLVNVANFKKDINKITFFGQTLNCIFLIFSPNSSMLAFCFEDKNAQLWVVETGQLF